MKNVVNVIKKPFITVAKFFSNIDWKNVKIPRDMVDLCAENCYNKQDKNKCDSEGG